MNRNDVLSMIHETIRLISSREISFEEAKTRYDSILEDISSRQQHEQDDVLQELIYSHIVRNCSKYTALLKWNREWEEIRSAGELVFQPVVQKQMNERSMDIADPFILDPGIPSDLTYRMAGFPFSQGGRPWCLVSLYSSPLHDHERFVSHGRMLKNVLAGVEGMNRTIPYRPFHTMKEAFENSAGTALGEGKSLRIHVIHFDNITDIFSFLGIRKLREIYRSIDAQIREWYSGHSIYPVTGNLYLVTMDEDQALPGKKPSFQYDGINLSFRQFDKELAPSDRLSDLWREVMTFCCYRVPPDQG
jgi:hypothetical protein